MIESIGEVSKCSPEVSKGIEVLSKGIGCFKKYLLPLDFTAFALII